MDENMQQPGGMSERETLLYQLFKRHLFRTGQEPENQVLVGQIPVDLPEKVPLPLGSRVLGTILSWQYIEILFDATLSPTAVIDFYKEQLSQTGWQEREQVLRTVLGERGMGMSPADTSSETSETDYKYQECVLQTALH